MITIMLHNRKSKWGVGYDYCEDIHTERLSNGLNIVFTSRRHRFEFSLKEYDFRIEKEQEE